MRATIPLFVMAGTLLGCAPATQYIKADGDYATAQQIAADRAACEKTNDRYCMVERGYFLVPKGQAEAMRTELAARTEEQRKETELQAAAQAKKQAAERAKKQAAERARKRAAQQARKQAAERAKKMAAERAAKAKLRAWGRTNQDNSRVSTTRSPWPATTESAWPE